jgi:murein DD-endopeptidase MepM/ murein hydrolase activator NlpD
MGETSRTLVGTWLVAILLMAGPAGAASPQHPASHPQSSASHPSSVAVERSKLAAVDQQLAERQQQLAHTRLVERQALAQLSWAQDRLDRAKVSLKQTTGALDGTRQAVVGATQALRAVSARLETHEALMDARLRAAYERGTLGYLDVVLGASDFRDFVTRSYLLGVIITSDLRLYEQVGAERRQQSAVRETLAQREARLAQQQERWRVSRDQIAQLADARAGFVARVRAQRLAEEEAVRELETESIEIARIIQQATRGGHIGPVPTLAGGALLWPVTGRISSPYGWRVHPIFRTREFHTGIDIAVPWGTPIHAAAAGTVIFTGWMRGYGMLVILDHGNGLSTTYSHLSSYVVHDGERVDRGQVIAKIGSTGWSTGPHLFFEVRETGQPVKPLGN